MEILKIGKREYKATRKEHKSLDYSLRTNAHGLNYYYCSFEGGYAIEELADALAYEPSVVLFYIPRNNSIAIVFAYSDKKTKFIDLEGRSHESIRGVLKWLSAVSSCSGEIVVANSIPANLLDGVNCRYVEKQALLSASSSSRKLLDSVRRNVTRALAVVFIGCGLAGGMIVELISQRLEDVSIAKERELSLLERKILKLEKLKLSSLNAVAQKNSGINLGINMRDQSFSNEIAKLDAIPAAILVKNGELLK